MQDQSKLANGTPTSSLTDERSRRLAFIRFSQEDAALLRELAPLIEVNADIIVEDFYQNMAQYPELMDIVAQAGSSIERLKKQQRKYLLEMFSGDYGQEYFNRRRTIGVVHNRIGLGPQWYLGSYVGYTKFLVPLIIRKYRFRLTKAAKAIEALNKIIYLDSQLAIEAYVLGVTEELKNAMESYTQFVDEVSDGNLAIKVDLPQNKDLARLGIRLNEMTTNLAEMTSRTSKASDGLAITVSDMLEAVSNQSSSANQQATAINETTSTLEEIRAISKQTQEKAEALGLIAERTKAEGEKGVEVVELTIGEMDAISNKVQDIAEKILTLSEQTQQIGEITGTVNGLAQQLKMLSLNASIEAAKAGEAGKGFAVVAAEVKDLAEQSQQATIQVNAILQEIQRATDKAVMVTEEGSKGVDMGMLKVQQVGEAMQSLTSAIREASMASQHIVAAVRQEGMGINQIATAMSEINNATRQVVDSTNQTKSSAEKLSDLASQMRDSIRSYRTDT